MHKRLFLQAFAAFGGSALLAPAPSAQSRPRLEVWKDPNCGCCQDWVAHMQAGGFDVQVHDSGNSAARKRLGVPEHLGSCHTGRVGGYAIEGHVPAGEVRRLLRERPAAVGLSVPGMPVGSPGMNGPAYGERRDAYDVLLVLRGGNTRVYQRYPQG